MMFGIIFLHIQIRVLFISGLDLWCAEGVFF